MTFPGNRTLSLQQRYQQKHHLGTLGEETSVSTLNSHYQRTIQVSVEAALGSWAILQNVCMTAV